MTQEPRPTPLLPCPFCGGEAHGIDGGGYSPCRVGCFECDIDAANVKNWNRRTPRTLTPEQVERARALTKHYPTQAGREFSVNEWIRLSYQLLREVVSDE